MYCRFILSIWLVLVSMSAFAQDTRNVKRGDVFMKKGDYATAASFYKKAADENMNDLVAKEKLAKAFKELGDFQSAEAVYHILATSPTADVINKFYYAQMLRMNGKYDVAGMQYKAYFEARPDDPLAVEFRNFATNIQVLQKDEGRYKLTNIPENSAGSDAGPTFCVYDFCYTSNGHSSGKKGTYDLYMLRGGNPGNPASPQKLKGKVNGRLDEGPATFSSNGMEMIFTQRNYGHRSKDGVIKFGLYHAEYDSINKSWLNVMPLSITDFNYNFMQPSLSKDGSKLFFVSDIPGGLGETDIYMCTRQGNTWGQPVNLTSLNTVGKEETPFIAEDGTLYFASDSRMGLGGFDIYAATLADTVWSHVTNLGVPINSAYNDFGYVSDPIGHSGYIVSNRPGGVGGNDIYHFTASNELLSAGGDVEDNATEIKKSIELEVNVSQQGGSKLQGVSAVLFNPATGKKMEQTSDSDGYVKFDAEANQEYVLKVFKTDMQQGGYEKFVRPISTIGLKPGQTIREEAQLIYHDKMDNTEASTSTGFTGGNVAGGALQNNGLPTVYFALGSYSIDATTKKKLDEVVKLMRANPSVEVEISSNTDATGDLRTNMALSAKRSLTCLNYLVSRGISKSRFIAVGYGAKNQLNNCAKPNHCTDAERAMSRRTEFKFIKQ